MRKRFTAWGFIFLGLAIGIFWLVGRVAINIGWERVYNAKGNVFWISLITYYVSLFFSFLCFVGGLFSATRKAIIASGIGLLIIVSFSLTIQPWPQGLVNKKYTELRIQVSGPKDWLECQKSHGVLQYNYDTGQETCGMGGKIYTYNHKIFEKVMSVEEFLSNSKNLDNQDVTIRGIITFLGRADSLGLGYGIPGLISKKTPGLARGVGLYASISDSERGKEVIVRGIYYAKDDAIRFPKIIKP